MLIIDNRTGRRPAGDIWEQAGSKIETMPAREALAMFPDYEPRIEDLFRLDDFNMPQPTGFRGIFMNGFEEPLTVVKGRYTQVTPKAFVDLWDKHVKLPVMAMGAAGSMGEIFYLAADMGKLEIKNDPVQMFLMGTAPQGNRSTSVRITPVRMFCINQMHASRRRAVINANIAHNGKIDENLSDWMHHLSVTVKERLKLVEKDFNTMIEADATQTRINTFIEKVYKLPTEQDFEALPKAIGERRSKEYATHVSMIEGRRREFVRFYDGAMTGATNLDGTMYRAYNAAVELAQYRKGISNEDNRAVSALFGKRAEEIEGIYEATMEIIRDTK